MDITAARVIVMAVLCSVLGWVIYLCKVHGALDIVVDFNGLCHFLKGILRFTLGAGDTARVTVRERGDGC